MFSKLNQILDQRACSALGGHHDRYSAHPLQRCLAHCVRVRVLSMCRCHHWFEAHRAVAAHNGRRGWGRVCGDHQSLWWWERMAAIGKRCRCCRCVLRVAGQWGRTRRCGHCTMTMSCGLGLTVHAMSSSGEGLACVSIVACVGVGVIVGFGVVPVAAVVGVGRRQCVVL